MNFESFEKEVIRLENQLQQAITTLGFLKDVQATFQDLQPRYESLKEKIAEVSRLPDEYTEKFNSARKAADERLEYITKQFQQIQNDFRISITENHQKKEELKKEVKHSVDTFLESAAAENHQKKEELQKEIEYFLRAVGTRYGAMQEEVRQETQQRLVDLKNAIQIEIDARFTVIQQEIISLENTIRREIKRRFFGAILISILITTAALGALAWLFWEINILTLTFDKVQKFLN